jgi:hypothetical protein
MACPGRIRVARRRGATTTSTASKSVPASAIPRSVKVYGAGSLGATRPSRAGAGRRRSVSDRRGLQRLEPSRVASSALRARCSANSPSRMPISSSKPEKGISAGVPPGWTKPSTLPSAERSISRTSRKSLSPSQLEVAVKPRPNCRLGSGGCHWGKTPVLTLITADAAYAERLSSARASSRRERTPSFM